MVNTSLTNRAEGILDKELINNKLTNYYYILENVPEEYVNKVLTNYSRGTVAPQIILYIMKNKAFTIPTLSYIFGTPRQTVDQVLKRLRPWVIQTKIRLEHPGQGPGNRPNVWVREGMDIHEGVNEARRLYYDVLQQHDPAVKHQGSIKIISQRIFDQLIEEGMIHGNPDRIIEKCREIPKVELHPSDYQTVTSQVFAILRARREGSP